MVHYADAYTTYGPLRGATSSLRFFTLRAERSDLTGFMPEDRNLLAYRGLRNLHFEPPERPEPLAPAETARTTIFEPGADGLGAQLLTAGPGARVEVLSSVGSSGQYVYVADGAVEWEGQRCGEESLGWCSPEDDAVALQAGAEGCRLVVMRLPSPPTKVAHGKLAGAASTS